MHGFLLALLTVALCGGCTKKSSAPQSNEETKATPQFQVKIKPKGNSFNPGKATQVLDLEYSVTTNQCTLVWEVHKLKDKAEYMLRTRQPGSSSCELSFEQQAPIHRAILKKVFTQWKPSQFNSMMTSGLRSLQPDGEWSAQVALRSHQSSDWQDYRKNYPNHKSGKSTNSLLVELANDPPVYKGLIDLFAEFGIKVQLSEVEKVFAQPAKKLDFFDKVKGQVPDDARLIYDAGAFWYRLSPQSN